MVWNPQQYLKFFGEPPIETTAVDLLMAGFRISGFPGVAGSWRRGPATVHKLIKERMAGRKGRVVVGVEGSVALVAAGKKKKKKKKKKKTAGTEVEWLHSGFWGSWAFPRIK